MRIRAQRIFTGTQLVANGVLEVEEGRVVAVHHEADGVDLDLGDVLVAPGYVDVHCHGGGGASFSQQPQAVLDAHLKHGTTTMIASLVSQSLEALEAQLGLLAPLVEDGTLGGVHLEGPWLAPGRKGAHPADKLRAPAPSEVERLLDAGQGAVKMVTLAPELTGAIESIELIAGRGVVAAIGHTDATLAMTRQAVSAGATGATHLFNAMPPLLHRKPGPILGLLEDERVWLELIADGVHVEPALIVELMHRYPGRVVLVTDAMAAACSPDGDYRLGDLPVTVTDGIAHIAGTDTIAGSTLTLDRAVRTVVSAGGPMLDALRAASILPARYMGLDDVGELAHGKWADAVVLDARLKVQRVMRRGEWVS